MLDQLIGEHPALRNARKQLPALAASHETLLIVGEQGTGKTLLAQHIHSQSSFAAQRMQSVDLRLLEDRYQRIFLFGAVPPALTTTRRSPLELPTTLVIKHPEAAYQYLQATLAHTLRTAEVRRTDARESRPVLARIIVHLTQHPDVLKNAGELHPLLCEFLATCRNVTLPPLRNHRKDIPTLAQQFINQEVRRHKQCKVLGTGKGHKPSRSLLRLLHRHRWNGNIMEMKAFIHALVMCSPEDIMQEAEHLLLTQTMLMMEEGRDVFLREQINQLKGMLVARAFRQYGANQMTAARKLGLTNVAVRQMLSASQSSRTILNDKR